MNVCHPVSSEKQFLSLTRGSQQASLFLEFSLCLSFCTFAAGSCAWCAKKSQRNSMKSDSNSVTNSACPIKFYTLKNSVEWAAYSKLSLSFTCRTVSKRLLRRLFERQSDLLHGSCYQIDPLFPSFCYHKETSLHMICVFLKQWFLQKFQYWTVTWFRQQN